MQTVKSYAHEINCLTANPSSDSHDLSPDCSPPSDPQCSIIINIYSNFNNKNVNIHI